MKKIYLSALLALGIVGGAFAQESAGGFPMSSKMVKVQNQDVDYIELPRPDFEAIMKQNEADERAGIARPYAVATMLTTDLNLSNSGTWYYLEDGQKIWRLSISIPEAKAIGLLYDQFYLPAGVKFFISNKNGRQVLGAYTAKNNNEKYKNFANQPIQGNTANLEIDVPAEVAVDDIVFHLNKVSAFYRSVGHLTKRYGDLQDATPAKPTAFPFDPGSAASCTIDANCPFSIDLESDYEVPKNASVRILIANQQTGIQGFCSGTLINSTGNSENGECVPYLLTASHCDENNSFSSSNFSQWLFNFNFRYDSCGSGNIEGASMNSVLTGADFVARSYYPSFGGGSNPRLVGDFLLLKLKVNPNSYGTYYAGWNRNTDIPFNQEYNYFFIGYHYPTGDVEKRSFGYQVAANGTFNQNQVPGTHWEINCTSGGTQGGSSGSGLFDVKGRLIGDLSGGPETGCGNVTDYGPVGLYSKISNNWENEFDQTNHPRPAGQESQSRLKDWLDPINSGQMTLNALKPDCTPVMGIHDLNEELNNGIEIFPSPSTTGIIQARTNLSEPTTLKVSVYNSIGQKVKEFTLNKAYKGNYSFDCSQLADGLYIMKFSGEQGIATKKIIIAR